MNRIDHSDSCSVGSATQPVKVSVTFRGAHTGVFEVIKAGNVLAPDPDGTVPVGDANTLAGTSILVKTIVNQVAAAGPFFEVDYVLQGVTCGPFIVRDSFDAGDPTAQVRETIAFV